MKRILAGVLIALFLTAPAMAALTITKAAGYPIVTGNKLETVVTVTFDSSYPTGGESFTAANLGLTTVDFVSVGVDTARTRLVTVWYDYTNYKLMAFYTAALDSVRAATSAATVATEIGNTYNLSTWTGKFVVKGN